MKLSSWKMALWSSIESFVTEFLPEPQGSLALGMAFGKDLDKTFLMHHSIKNIGMSHVVAASGFNVGLVLGIMQPFLNHLPRLFRFLLQVAAIWFYIWFSGGSASLLRASLMTSISLVAQLLFRKVSALFALTLSVLIALCVDPSLATSISLQLSAAATLGILFYADILTATTSQLTKWFGSLPQVSRQGNRGQHDSFSPASLFLSLKRVFIEAILLCLAAQTFVLPLVAYHFREINLVAFISNPALIWLTPLTTIASIVVLIWGATFSRYFPNPVVAELSMVALLPLTMFTRPIELTSHVVPETIIISQMSFLQLAVCLLIPVVIYLRIKITGLLSLYRSKSLYLETSL